MEDRLEIEEIIARQGKLDPDFKETVKQYIKADLQCKDAKEHRDLAQEPVEDYVRTHGVLNRPGTKQAVLIADGWKVQYTCRQGATKYDEKARLAWCRDHAPDLLVMQPVVDEQKWAAAKALKQIPTKVLEQVEKSGLSYYLAVWLLGDAACPSCDEKVHVDNTFCPRCGLRLPFNKKRGKTKPKPKAEAKAKATDKPKAKAKKAKAA